MSKNASFAEEVDVAVVGGGPAGLAVALGLAKSVPELSVRVFESGRHLQPSGAGVLLNINGWRALRSLDEGVYQRLEKSAVRLGPISWYHEDGSFNRQTQSFPHEDNLQRFGMTQAVVPWYEIRDALYAALPPGIVQLGVRGTQYEELPDGSGVVLKSQQRSGNGSDGKGGDDREMTVRAKVLVGSDGFFSRIREQVLGDGPPDFTGRVTWRARVRWEQGDEPPALRAINGQSGGGLWINPEKIGKDRYVIVYPVGGGEYVWTATAPVRYLEAKGHTFQAASKESGSNMTTLQQDGGGTASTLQRCVDAFADYPDDVKAMLAATPAELVTEHGFYIRDPKQMPPSGWGHGCVTLVGDAAHVAPPDGQGCNLALEDAAVLADCMRQGGLTPETLRAFEVQRLPRVQGVLSLPEGNPDRQHIIETPFLPATLQPSKVTVKA